MQEVIAHNVESTGLNTERDKWGRIKTPPVPSRSRQFRRFSGGRAYYAAGSYPGTTPELSCHIINERKHRP